MSVIITYYRESSLLRGSLPGLVFCQVRWELGAGVKDAAYCIDLMSCLFSSREPLQKDLYVFPRLMHIRTSANHKDEVSSFS